MTSVAGYVEWVSPHPAPDASATGITYGVVVAATDVAGTNVVEPAANIVVALSVFDVEETAVTVAAPAVGVLAGVDVVGVVAAVVAWVLVAAAGEESEDAAGRASPHDDAAAANARTATERLNGARCWLRPAVRAHRW
jgi:predicted branched-subunit amino acid permease